MHLYIREAVMLLNFINRVYEYVDLIILVPLIMGSCLGALVSIFIGNSLLYLSIGGIIGLGVSFLCIIIFFILCRIESKNN